MLEIVFFNILLTSIMAAMLVILILLVKVIFKEKLSAKWHYYIWLILIVRLIIPYTPEFSPKINDIFPQIKDNVSIQTENHTIGPDTNSNANLKNNNERNIFEYNTNYNSEAIDEKDVSQYSKVEGNNNDKLSLTILGIASKIWVIGIFFFSFYLIFINCIMYFKIKRSSVTVDRYGIQNILDECRKLVNIISDIPIIYQKHIKTPAIFGVFKPKMLVPVNILNQLSPDETRYVVLHELCHFKRRDTVIGMLQILLCILYWFNPLIWYASCKMKADREPVCDEMVLSCIKPVERRSYAETLIKMLKCFSESHWTYSTANMSQGGLENMEWRLKLINIIKKRSVILGIVIALVTAALGAVVILVINSYLSYASPVNSIPVDPVGTNQAANLITSTDKKFPTRGKILDRNGKELAVSIPADTIAINPREIKASWQDTGSIAKSLANFLALEETEVMQKVTASSVYEIIGRKVDKETGNKIRDWVRNNNIKGIMIDEDTKRSYPDNTLAAHVIGFTGVDEEGLYGIELSMNQYLKSKGTSVRIEGKETLEGGMNVVLTIDEGIQSIVEKALDKAIEEYKTKNGATAIVMNPKNGEMLALASKSDFDLNNPRGVPKGKDPETWTGKSKEDVEYLQQTVWRNKAVVDTYEPGSTFKPVTAAAGLEEGAITPDTQVTDATVKVGGWNINCWKPNAHLHETFREGVYNSCNPVFVSLSRKLGVPLFFKYVKAFGFYDKTGIDLPGEARSIFFSNPTEIDMATSSFGQRFQITPIQLASAYCTIANGGKLMEPQIVKQIVNTGNSTVKTFKPQVIRNVISPKTSESMKAILEGVVSKGTASNAYVKGYKFAGCAGTGEKANGQYISSFAGFAPADNPEIVCIVILDEPMENAPKGGTAAAPVAGKLMRDITDYIQ